MPYSFDYKGQLVVCDTPQEVKAFLEFAHLEEARSFVNALRPVKKPIRKGNNNTKPETKSKILKLAREGNSLREISKATGVSKVTVMRLRDKAGIAPTKLKGGWDLSQPTEFSIDGKGRQVRIPVCRELSPEDLQHLKDTYAKSGDSPSLGSDLDMGRVEALQVLRKAGVEIKYKRAGHTTNAALPAPKRLAVLKDYEDGMSGPEVAEKHGTCTQTVHLWAIAAGIPIRKYLPPRKESSVCVPEAEKQYKISERVAKTDAIIDQIIAGEMTISWACMTHRIGRETVLARAKERNIELPRVYKGRFYGKKKDEKADLDLSIMEMLGDGATFEETAEKLQIPIEDVRRIGETCVL